MSEYEANVFLLSHRRSFAKLLRNNRCYQFAFTYRSYHNKVPYRFVYYFRQHSHEKIMNITVNASSILRYVIGNTSLRIMHVKWVTVPSLCADDLRDDLLYLNWKMGSLFMTWKFVFVTYLSETYTTQNKVISYIYT